MTDYCPILITARMAGPLAGEAPHLDGLLEYAMSPHLASIERSRIGYSTGDRDLGLYRGKVTRATPAPPEGEIPIPLARVRFGGRLVSCCSSPIMAAVDTDSVEHYAKRFPTELAGLLDDAERRQVTTTNTWTKSYRLPLRIRNVSEIRWFAVGDRRDILKRLRKEIKSLGKKPSDGYGRVAEWTVERTDIDASLFAKSPHGTVLMRPLPFGDWLPSDLVGYRRDYGACSPPYWHPDRYGEIVVPC